MLFRSAITKARHFLESSASLVTDPYSSALTAYALTLLRSPAAPAALRKLRSLAITQGRCPCPPAQQTQEAAHGHVLETKEVSLAHSVLFTHLFVVVV